jgi:hypothetical protein
LEEQTWVVAELLEMFLVEVLPSSETKQKTFQDDKQNQNHCHCNLGSTLDITILIINTQTVGNQLPTYTTKYSRRAKDSTTPQTEVTHNLNLTTRYTVILSGDMIFTIHLLLNAIYMSIFKTVHNIRDSAHYLTPLSIQTPSSLTL